MANRIENFLQKIWAPATRIFLVSVGIYLVIFSLKRYQIDNTQIDAYIVASGFFGLSGILLGLFLPKKTIEKIGDFILHITP